MNPQNQICSQKNCNCGKQHVYTDEFTQLAKTNEGHAIELFQEKRDVLKQEVKKLELDRKKRPMVHCHLHTYHSILDGAGNMDDYIRLAKEYNHPAIAITDHGTVSGTFEFWKKCKAAGIKPIIGLEAYVNNQMGDFDDEKKHEGGASHQSIFVMNQEGYVSLNKLVYRSFTEGFYRRGRIKTDWLIENKNGLFITTSCAVSEMAKLVREGKEVEAEEYLKVLMREFGDNLAAELQFNEFDGQKIYNNWLIKMIKKYSLMPILTNDVHYAFPGEAVLQDTLIAINRKEKLSEMSFKLSTRNLFYASADDFYVFNKKFGYNYPEQFIEMCLENTLKVAEKCNFDFDTKTEKFPVYDASPKVEEAFKTRNTKEIITRLSFFKLRKRLEDYKKNNVVVITPEKEKEYHDRLTFELQVIEEKGALDYFLVYWELINDYTSKGYTIGPGRGSAGGCLLSYCLGITDIDPIRFELYFERFMNPTRKSMPDIDVDFEKDTDDVTDNFLYEKYGRNRVINVSTFTTFSEKNTLKDVVRAHYGEEFTTQDSDVEYVTKAMPNWDKVEYSLKDWFINFPKDPKCSDRVRGWLQNPSHKIIMEETLKLQGMVKGIGQHAAGIVITPGPCWEYLPVNIVAKQKSIVTAFQEADKSGKDLSELCILKLDRLKIETLNVIKEAIALIKEKKGIDVNDQVKNVDITDKNLFAELRLGMNNGIFQFESAGMGGIIKNMHTETFEELIAANALFRPGPMGIKAHEEYIKNKFSPEDIQYVHPALEPILSKTNGVLVYQEQLMFIAHVIGGMTLGEGDMLRRYMDKASSAIIKKNVGETLNAKDQANYAEFEKYWTKFLDGAAKQGYQVHEVDKIKDYVVKYLGYSFNRSHSCAYAFLAMRTLFLKHYYTTEFYTALFNHPKTFNDKDKTEAWLTSAIAAAMAQGIVIKPPSLKSGWHWTMTGDKEISMGFSAINGFGDTAYKELQELLMARKKKLDTITMAEFFELPFSKFNKTSFGASVKAGVFDSWSDSRQYLLSLKEKKKKKKVDAAQIFMFDMGGEEFNLNNQKHDFPLTTAEERRASFLEVCSFDLEKIGRISQIKEKIAAISKRPIENIINFEEDGWYYFILEDVHEATAKTGSKYLVLKVGDGISHQNLRIFPPMSEKVRPMLQPGQVYAAKFEKNESGFINILRNSQITKVDV